MLDFQDLYDTYAPDVYRFSLWLSGSRFEAEDITSETFIRAWTHNRSIRTETLKAYLLTIARNVYLEQLRKRKRHTVLNDIHPDPAPGPDKMAESQLALSRIRKILGTLPESDRAAFILRVQHALDYAEIARILELSLASAKVKVHRVRKKLLATIVNKEDCE